MNITQLISNNFVNFSHYRKGYLYYNIEHEGHTYQFPVPLDDTGDGTFNARDKASYFLRWIRQSKLDLTFIDLGHTFTVNHLINFNLTSPPSDGALLEGAIEYAKKRNPDYREDGDQ